ncbi:MAG: DUF3306 domain-containing protein [Burkholderiaceae bacterium]|nr:DUF3306 domain-containing protein [Burkholderiaceae bacterium]
MSADETFLNRWSRRKRTHADPATTPESQAQAPESQWQRTQPRPQALAARELPKIGSDPCRAPAPADGRSGAAGQARGEAAAQTGRQDPNEGARSPQPLPSVESLRHDSDFTAFMKTGVDPSTRAAALRRLFSDPHFNEMDGLDIYIDDYGKPDPIPLAMLRMMNQARSLGLFSDASDESGDGARQDRESAVADLKVGEVELETAVKERRATETTPTETTPTEIEATETGATETATTAVTGPVSDAGDATAADRSAVPGRRTDRA